MKDKAPLLLTEQLIMILVFALVAALCLQGFALAAQLSRDVRQQEQAALLAQSAAEELKASRQADGTQYFNDALEQVTAADDWCYCVQIQPRNSGISGLGQALILVDNPRKETLFSLTVGWQEG